MVEQLISTAEHDRLPDSYVRQETQRPRLCEVVPDAEIPVVDLAVPCRAAVAATVAEACRKYGFFQVVNHGVPEELTAAMMSVAYEFFRLPAEEKAKIYSDDPGKKMRLSTSFIVRKETVHNWRDYLRLHCHPLEQYVPDWPDNPPSFRHREEQQFKVENLDTYALATTQAQTTPGDGIRTPALWLDSGAGHHAVGDASVLCNLRDPPAGTAVRMADGFRLRVAKIGDIRTESFQIPDVYLVPGLQMNVISVRQLAKCKIFPTFYENHADLCREGERVGGAIVDDNASIYRLYYLAAVGINTAASTS